MNIKKCNICGKELTKDVDYFTIDEIAFTKGGKSLESTKVIFDDGDKSRNFSLTEDWVYYSDIDLCVECFKKENFGKFLK